MTVDIEKIVREYIDKTIHLSLATVQDNKPWVCEVHFAYDDHLNLYFRSLPSRRHSQEITNNPHVSGNIIDKYLVGEPVVGVYFEGVAEALSAGDEQNLAAQQLIQRLELKSDIVQTAQDTEKAQIYKIRVENWYIYGKFDGEKSAKYEIEWNKL